MGAADAPVVVTGEARNLTTGAAPAALRVEMAVDEFTLSLAGQPPMTIAYRDLTHLVVDQAKVLLVIDEATRVIAEQLGTGLTTLVGELRERRARQMLNDRLIEVPAGERLEMVEYEAGGEHAVAQMAFHPWGCVLMPLDERSGWRPIRRADISAVRPDQSTGSVSVDVAPRPGRAGFTFKLLGLGLDTVRWAQRIAALPSESATDAAAIAARLLANEPPTVRQRAGDLLVDGRPVSSRELGEDWVPIERSVLSEPTFAATYAALAARSGSDGSEAASWIALAPARPTDPTEHKAWFLVCLPGGLLAFEMVSEGAHATYLFRGRDSFEAAVFDVSEALIDSRFLRSAIYLTDSALADARNLRQRLAVAALPSLRAARERFVGRLIHSDEESWAKGLDDVIKWNSGNRDESARWPGTDQSEGE